MTVATRTDIPTDVAEALEYARLHLRVSSPPVQSYIDSVFSEDDTGPEVLSRTVGAALRKLVDVHNELPGDSKLRTAPLLNTLIDGHEVYVNTARPVTREQLVAALAYKVVEVALLEKATLQAAQDALPLLVLVVDSTEGAAA